MKNKKLFYYLILIITLLNFFTTFTGIDFTDTFWHINTARYYFTHSSLETEFEKAVLSIQIENSFLNNFSKRINFHYLSSLLVYHIYDFVGFNLWIVRVITFIILLFIFYFPSANKNINYKIFSLLIFNCFSIFNFNILSFDLFTIIISYFIISLINKNKYSNITLISIAIILCMSYLVRFQNFALIPLTFIFLNNKIPFKKNFLVHIPSILFFTYLYFYIEFFDISHKTSVTEHSFNKILNSNLTDLPHFILFLFIFIFINKLNDKNNKSFLIFIFSFVIMISFISEEYHWKHSLFISSFFITTIFFNESKFLENLKIVPFLFIFPLGSATGLYKLVYSLTLFPILISNFTKTYKLKSKFFFLSILPFCLYAKAFYNYEDIGARHAYHSIDHFGLKYIFTSKTRSDYIKNVQNKIHELQKEGYYILIGGAKSHVFNYINNFTPITVEFYQQDLEKSFFSKLLTNYNFDKIAYFHFDNYPEWNDNSVSNLEHDLLNLGFVYNQKLNFDFLTLDNIQRTQDLSI